MATKRMLVDAIHPEETRIVVTSGNRLEEFDFESAQRRQLRGNIYLAKVTRVEPSLQAAFIDYGGNRHGFLAFSEIHPDYYQIPVADREALLRDEEEEDHAESEAHEVSSAPTEADAEEDPQSTEPDDGDSSHIEQAPANSEPVESIGGGDALEEITERRRPSPSRRNYKIQEVIKRRQVMLVQVVKEERGNKGAALTTYLSLAGRYSVLMPNTARGGGISRKITNAADRKRLKDIVGDLEVPPGQGIILRTAGASRTKAEVKRDFEYLQRLWENVRSLTLKSQAPCLVYEEGSLIKRTIRDLYNKEVDELYVAGDDAYREAKDFMRMIMPSHAKNVQLYKEDQPIFSKYNVEPQLDSMFSPQVTLPSGGYIVINPTEALVSIDVNSGRSTKEHNIEDTALQTNLEAAEEISRQLRLRDLAGLIVIDFIDMVENRSNRAVERKLKDSLKNDRARIQVGRISHFGLMEMSRQRIRFGVVESSTHICPTCAGTGIVRSVESLALMVMRQVEDHVMRRPGQSVNVKVPTDVALYILNSKRGTLTQLELKYQLSITIIADDHVGGTHFAIEKGEARAFQPSEVRALEHVRVDTAAMDDIEEEPEEEAEIEEEGAEATASQPASGHGEDEHSRRRRRRRRRGGGDRGEEGAAQQQRQPQVARAAEESTSDDEEAEGGEDGVEPVGANAGPDGEEPRKRRRRGRRGGRRNRRGGEEAGTFAPQGEPVEAMDAVGLDTEEAAPSDGMDTPPLTSAPIEAEPEAPVTAEVEAAAPAEKPKRARRTRKVAPEVISDAPELADAAGPAVPDLPLPEELEAEEAKPKPKRTRKPKVVAPAAAEATETVSVSQPVEETTTAAPEAVTASEATAEAEPAGSRRRKKELPPEGIVVSSSAATTAAEAEAEAESQAKPKRAGWWQRGFLGGN
jgi:ribonuclease E